MQSAGKPRGYDAVKDPAALAPHPPKEGPGGTLYRGGQNFFSSPVHKSQTVDYGIVMQGERRISFAPNLRGSVAVYRFEKA